MPSILIEITTSEKDNNDMDNQYYKTPSSLPE